MHYYLVLCISGILVAFSKGVETTMESVRVSVGLQKNGQPSPDENHDLHLGYVNSMESRRMQLTIADFFNFTLSVSPDTDLDPTLCTLADQNMLRNGVDLLLLNFGSESIYEPELFTANLCTQPLLNNSSTFDSNKRRDLARTTWLWTQTFRQYNCILFVFWIRQQTIIVKLIKKQTIIDNNCFYCFFLILGFGKNIFHNRNIP